VDLFEDFPFSDVLPCLPHVAGEVCSGSMHATGSWGFVCSIEAYEGDWFAGSSGGAASLFIDDGVRAFGGYFGTNYAADSEVTFTFYNEAGAEIASDTVTFGDCGAWGWQGWEFAERVYSIEIAQAGIFGFAMMDALEFDTGPVGAPPPELTVLGSCPGPVRIDVSNVSAGAPWALLSSSGPGATVLPGGPCVGAESGLSPAGFRLRSLATSAPDGTDSLSVTLPPGACGASIQALDAATCSFTDVQTL
jgi:hypothetical protein